MYTASDIKKRIEEIKHTNAERQMKIIEEATNRMYEEGLTSITFSIEESALENEARQKIQNAGFTYEWVSNKSYRIYIPEEDE